MRLKFFGCVLCLACCARLGAQHASAIPTPLSVLLAEAQANNADIAVADDTWKSAMHVAQQVTARPGPQLSAQSVDVGSPKPFAGFSNSEFAYFGLGASQQFPYKEKLRLRGEVANREMETEKAGADVVRSTVAEQVKLLYLQISYSTGAISYLNRMDSVLDSLIQDAVARYSVGQGSQPAIFKAQLERTEIKRQDTMHNENLALAQVRIKQLLHRSQDSIDIFPLPLAETPFTRDIADLQAQLRMQNPQLQVDASAIRKQDAQVASAKREIKPDLNVGGQVDITGGGYRNRYEMSAQIELPNRSRVAGEVAQATEQANRARHELDAEVQRKQAELQEQYVAVESTTELLNEFTQGLLPQAEAVFHSEQSSFQANKEELAPVLSALLDVLQLENDYQQAIFDHEAALVRMETLTGETLR